MDEPAAAASSRSTATPSPRRSAALKVAGVVLVGALSTQLDFAAETWEQAIAGNVPAGWLDMNLAAFAAGREVGALSAASP